MDALALDPVLARACGAAIAVVLLTGAWQKLRDLAVGGVFTLNIRKNR